MGYYKLMYDADKGEDDYAFANAHPTDEKYIDEEMDRYMVDRGEIVNYWRKNLRFQYDTKDGYILSDYLWNIYAWLMVSEKFKKLTESLVRGNIQYLPIIVINEKTKEENYSFFVANILALVEAIELSESEYFVLDDEDENDILYSIIKPALKKEVIKEHHIFRAKEDIFAIYISEEMKNIIESNNLLGFSFLEVKVV